MKKIETIFYLGGIVFCMVAAIACFVAFINEPKLCHNLLQALVNAWFGTALLSAFIEGAREEKDA